MKGGFSYMTPFFFKQLYNYSNKITKMKFTSILKKVILEQSRFELFYNRFLTKEYGSVEPIESDDKISFMKNGDEVFTYYKKLKGLTLSHHVSGFLRNIFGFNFDDTEDIFDKWFSKHFNLEVDFNRKDYIRNYIKNQKLKLIINFLVLKNRKIGVKVMI